MRLVRFRHMHKEHYGIRTDSKTVNLPLLAKAINEKIPKRLEDLITLGHEGVESMERLLKKAGQADVARASCSSKETTLFAPIPFPPKIICLGLNYRDHAAETNKCVPDEPVIFMKPHTAIIGPNKSIVNPRFVKELDYEAELAIIVGRKAKNVPVAEAQDFIFGYTVFNDVSARDIQFRDKQWTRGKSFDTFAPTGPCITTVDQLPDTSDLAIRTWVNGELRQNSTTRNMAFNVYEIVHELSRVMTLEPCDIIATGTPAGVGFAMKPQPRFLRAGDVVKIEIEKIGILENTVVDEK